MFSIKNNVNRQIGPQTAGSPVPSQHKHHLRGAEFGRSVAKVDMVSNNNNIEYICRITPRSSSPSSPSSPSSSRSSSCMHVTSVGEGQHQFCSKLSSPPGCPCCTLLPRSKIHDHRRWRYNRRLEDYQSPHYQLKFILDNRRIGDHQNLLDHQSHTLLCRLTSTPPQNYN